MEMRIRYPLRKSEEKERKKKQKKKKSKRRAKERQGDKKDRKQQKEKGWKKACPSYQSVRSQSNILYSHVNISRTSS